MKHNKSFLCVCVCVCVGGVWGGFISLTKSYITIQNVRLAHSRDHQVSEKGACIGVMKIAGESKKTHGIKCHWELKNKGTSIRTHIFWCKKN